MKSQFSPEGTALRPRRGVAAISRGSSEATPPDKDVRAHFDPGGVAVVVLMDRTLTDGLRGGKAAVVLRMHPAQSISPAGTPPGCGGLSVTRPGVSSATGGLNPRLIAGTLPGVLPEESLRA